MDAVITLCLGIMSIVLLSYVSYLLDERKALRRELEDARYWKKKSEGELEAWEAGRRQLRDEYGIDMWYTSPIYRPVELPELTVSAPEPVKARKR